MNVHEFLEDISLQDVAYVVVPITIVFTFLLRKVWPWFSRTKDFIDDLMGEPARPGVEARPGLMDRVKVVEVKVASAEYHSKPNGGNSAYDDLMREVTSIGTRLDEHISNST